MLARQEAGLYFWDCSAGKKLSLENSDLKEATPCQRQFLRYVRDLLSQTCLFCVAHLECYVLLCLLALVGNLLLENLNKWQN